MRVTISNWFYFCSIVLVAHFHQPIYLEDSQTNLCGRCQAHFRQPYSYAFVLLLNWEFYQVLFILLNAPLASPSLTRIFCFEPPVLLIVTPKTKILSTFSIILSIRGKGSRLLALSFITLFFFAFIVPLLLFQLCSGSLPLLAPLFLNQDLASCSSLSIRSYCFPFFPFFSRLYHR